MRKILHLFHLHTYRCRGFAECWQADMDIRQDYPFRGWWRG